MATSTQPVRQFDYLGIDRQGKQQQGIITSSSAAMARAQLRRQGLIKLIHLRKQNAHLTAFRSSIKGSDITALTRQLATLLKAGVPLMKAFDILLDGLGNKRLIRVVSQISHEVAAGNRLSAALRQHPHHFSSLYCALVEAGELAGALDVMLERLALHQEKTEQLRKKIRSALAYPATILIIAVAITILLLLKVVPTFANLFTSFGAPLPTATRIVMNLSQGLQSYWLALTLLSVTAVSAIRLLMHRSTRFRHVWQQLSLKLPVFGPLLHQAAMARFSRTLSITFAAGVPLVQALQSAAGTSTNVVYTQAINNTAKAVETGTELAVAMQQNTCFPVLLIQMVGIGEQSGTLDSMLARTAAIYEDNVDQQVSALTAIMEPLIMTVLGLLVGGLVVSMYLPIFRMGAVIG
ncbi:type II secretion system protein F [Saccharospirillum sp. MSK14-1]|uniref:type II secretion system F family protein n=1 Tax=Saccharospirillum sp. MSK14-1 TaxID=1897632 RepID=UPI000D3C6FFB|nr:type II secretion system F family protein [Saccharospirillum sp. MSK14-1]PTY38963.1 type II secretion system protein F [Saccharospirillum sp. MSK14-1]